jgi:hypothetical protein
VAVDFTGRLGGAEDCRGACRVAEDGLNTVATDEVKAQLKRFFVSLQKKEVCFLFRSGIFQ